MPNVLVGKVENTQELLKASFSSKRNDIVPFKFSWNQNSLSYSNIANTRCVIEFSVRYVLDKTLKNSRLSTPLKSSVTETFYKNNKAKEDYLNKKINGIRV